MAVDLAIRSEKESLGSLSEALAAIRATKDTEELAGLLLLVTMLYGDSSCRCEEQAAAYTEEAEEVKTCNRDVSGIRDEMLETFRGVVRVLKGG